MLPIRIRKQSIFNKLVLAFLVVMTPLYLLGTFIFDTGSRIVDREISTSLQKQVQFYLMSLETEIERMVILQREFMNDSDLIALSMMAERFTAYERLAAMRRLQARLNLIKESSEYIADARAYIPSVSRIISSNDAVIPLDQSRLDELKQDALAYHPPFIHMEGEMYIREYYPSPYNLDERNPTFVLELQISLPSVYSYLEQLPGYENGGAALIFENAVIVSGKHEASFKRIRPFLEQQLQVSRSEAKTGSFEAVTSRLSVYEGDYLTVHLYSQQLHANLFVYVPEKAVMGPLERYRMYMWLISAISLMVIVAFAYWIYRIIHRPLRKLVGAFRKVESGNMQVEIRHNSHDEFHYLYDKFNYMVGRLNKLIYEVYEQKIHLQQSELKQLQSQINPHFLYNSFYLLYRMIKAEDIENATRFTRFLGDYYQYITRNARDEVRLEDEIRHVQAYIAIQSIRFGDRIRADVGEATEVIKNIPVPRLMLQPIVENVYEHAFNLDMEECRLFIGFEQTRSISGMPLLCIIVQDNGIGMSDEEIAQWQQKLNHDRFVEEVTGILNVHRRLRLKYGPDAGIRMESKGTGLTVKLMIPMTWQEQTLSKHQNTEGESGNAAFAHRG